MTYVSLSSLAHQYLACRLQAGNRVLDATMGNGHDTLFLAKAVGPQGRVYAFDQQKRALENTRQRLLEYSCANSVTLIQADHATIATHVSDPVQAVMFNLGYLPGGDKTQTTMTHSTLSALNACIQLLPDSGNITIIAYPGHPGGDSETEAVQNWIARLPEQRFETQCIIPPASRHAPPRLFIVHKRDALILNKTAYA